MPRRRWSLVFLSAVAVSYASSGVARAQIPDEVPPRSAGIRGIDGVRFEVGAVNPAGAEYGTTFGIAAGLGTIVRPDLDFNLALRYWSADLDRDGPQGKASVHDRSFHTGIYWHPVRWSYLRPYGTLGAGLHFTGADIPGDPEREEDYDALSLGADLGLGVETIFTGINLRAEARRETGGKAESWSAVVAAGWWPRGQAIAGAGRRAEPDAERGGSVPVTIPDPSMAAASSAVPEWNADLESSEAPASDGVSASGADSVSGAAPTSSDLAAAPTLQTQGDSLRAGRTLRLGADRGARIRDLLERLADLSGHPDAVVEIEGVPAFTDPEVASFASGGALLDDASRQRIRRFAAVLLVCPEIHVELIGHADRRGSARLNMSISEQRARAVADELVSLGVPAANISVRGEGSARPIADDSTPEGRTRNRRVEGRLAPHGGDR